MAIRLNGTDQFLSAALSGLPSQPYTMLAWGRRRLAADLCTAVGIQNSGSATALQWYDTAPRAVSWGRGTANGAVSQDTSSPHCLIGVFGLSQVLLGFDGVETAQALAPTVWSPATLTIGNSVGYVGPYLWDGELSHVAVWTCELTAAERAALTARTVNPMDVRPDKLLAYLPLDDSLEDLVGKLTWTPTALSAPVFVDSGVDYPAATVAQEIAQAVWARPYRTLDGEAPAAAGSTLLDQIAHAVWTYPDRTLWHEPEPMWADGTVIQTLSESPVDPEPRWLDGTVSIVNKNEQAFFRSGFETGDLSEFDGSSGSNISVSALARKDGSYGLLRTYPDSGNSEVFKDIPSGIEELWLSYDFYVPVGLTSTQWSGPFLHAFVTQEYGVYGWLVVRTDQAPSGQINYLDLALAGVSNQPLEAGRWYHLDYYLSSVSRKVWLDRTLVADAVVADAGLPIALAFGTWASSSSGSLYVDNVALNLEGPVHQYESLPDNACESTPAGLSFQASSPTADQHDNACISSPAALTLNASSPTADQPGAVDPHLIHSIKFNSSAIAYDEITSAQGTLAAHTEFAYAAPKDFNGEILNVQGNRYAASDIANERECWNSITLPVVSLTTFTIRIWMKINDGKMGAIFRQHADGWHPRINSLGIIDNFGATVEVGIDWGEFMYRRNAGGWQALWNGTVIGSGPDGYSFLGGLFSINAYGSGYCPGVDIALMQVYDEYRTDTTNLMTFPGILNNRPDGVFIGTQFREENDSGEHSTVTLEGPSAFDVSFPGVVCWGCTQGRYTTDYIRLAGNVRYDDFVLGTGHISDQIQIVGLFAGDRGSARVRLAGIYDTGTDTVPRVDLYIAGNNYTVHGPITSQVTYDWELIRTATHVIVTFDGVTNSYEVALTDDNYWMVGLNLGMHFQDWEAHYTNLEYELAPSNACESTPAVLNLQASSPTADQPPVWPGVQLYVDFDAATDGNGSEGSPYNNWASLFATANHPAVRLDQVHVWLSGSYEATSRVALTYAQTTNQYHWWFHGNRTQPGWDESAFFMHITNDDGFQLGGWSHFLGLQIRITSTGFANIALYADLTGESWVDGCILRGNAAYNAAAQYHSGVEANSDYHPVHVRNCSIYDFRGGTGINAGIWQHQSAAVYAENNTILNCSYCIYQNGGDNGIFKNNVAKLGSGTECYAFDTLERQNPASTNNTSSDASRLSTDATNLLSQALTFQDEATGDLRLTSADTSCIDNAEDLSAYANGAFDTDALGTDRGTWDRGAFAYVNETPNQCESTPAVLTFQASSPTADQPDNACVSTPATMSLQASSPTANQPGAGHIIDHTHVDLYDEIPTAILNAIKTRWFDLPGESHSSGYRNGLQWLENQNANYAVSITQSGTPEGASSDHLRVSAAAWGDVDNATGWMYSHGEEDWYTSATARSRMIAHLAYCAAQGNVPFALGFGWCWDMTWLNDVGGTMDPVHHVRWAGSSASGPEGNLRWGLDAADQALTGNSVCMDTYLAATQAMIDFCEANSIPTNVFFTTGPVDGYTGENGLQREIKHQYIRDYVNENGGWLFDYADILCWDDTGTPSTAQWTDSYAVVRTFPNIAYDNLLDFDGSYGDGSGHIGERGELRLAKAVWVMLAMMEGWSPAGSDNACASTPAAVTFQASSPTVAQEHALTAVGLTMGAPDLGAPALVQIHPFTANGVTAGVPSSTASSLGQIHALSATGITTGAAAVGSPAFAQTHALTTPSLATGAPAVTIPAVGQVHALTATGTAAGIPSLGAPALGQVHSLEAQNLHAGTPEATIPSVGQVHDLADPSSVSAGTPDLGTPEISSSSGLFANDLDAGVPELGTPAIAQVHVLSAQDLSAGAVDFQTPSVGQTHELDAQDLSAGTPDLGTPDFYSASGLLAVGITTGEPSLGTPAISQTHSLSAAGITTGEASLGSPAFTQTHTLSPNGVTAGTPELGTPEISSNSGLFANGITTGEPTLGQPVLGQVQPFTAIGVNAGVPEATDPVFRQVQPMEAIGVTAGVPTATIPEIDEVYVFAAIGVDAGAPRVGTPVLGQTHTLSIDGLATGAPTLEPPVFKILYELEAVGFDAGDPDIGTPTLGVYLPRLAHVDFSGFVPVAIELSSPVTLPG